MKLNTKEAIRNKIKILLLPFGYVTEDKLDEIAQLIKDKEVGAHKAGFDEGWKARLKQVIKELKGETQ